MTQISKYNLTKISHMLYTLIQLGLNLISHNLNLI